MRSESTAACAYPFAGVTKIGMPIFVRILTCAPVLSSFFSSGGNSSKKIRYVFSTSVAATVAATLTFRSSPAFRVKRAGKKTMSSVGLSCTDPLASCDHVNEEIWNRSG